MELRPHDASAVEVLLAAAVDDEALSSAARESLADLEGEEVDAAIAKAFDTAEGNKRLVLIGLIGDRGIAAAVPALKQAAGDEELEVATAAIKALSTTIELDELSVLIDLLVSSASAEKSTAAKEALKIAVLRMPDRDATSVKLLAPMDDASATGKVNLLDLLGIVGGEKALKGVAAAARSGREDERGDLWVEARVVIPAVTGDRARELLEVRLAVNENDQRIHAALGVVYAGLRREQDARRHAIRAVELAPPESDALSAPIQVIQLARTLTLRVPEELGEQS